MHTPVDSDFGRIRLPGIGPHFTGRFRWLGYALALLLVAAVGLLGHALLPWLRDEPPMLPFVLVVTIAGYFGGRGPALLSIVASALTAHLLFGDAFDQGYKPLAWSVHLALFAIVGALTTEGIHRLQRATAALRDSESRLRAILDGASAIVFLKDRDGRYLFVNQELLRIFSLAHQVVFGKTAFDFFPPAIASSMAEHDLRVWNAAAPCTMEESVPQADGLHTYVCTKFLLRDSRGEPYALCGIATDITGQKKIEDALREADRRKDVFLATLSHELRNPLAPICHAARVLRTPGISARDAEHAREIIERQSQHLGRLLDDLLDVSRITRGSLELRKQILSISTVVESALEAARPLLESRRHTLTVEGPAQPLHVKGDAVRLSQVLANLLTNAAKYTPAGGRIRIRVFREEDDVVLSVSDNGIGIPADVLPRIFEMFSQGRSEREHAEGGLGIGLALVRGLLELHGGTIEARSEGRGRGSEFIVRVPACDISVAEAAEPGSDFDEISDTYRVLIADDNRDAADSLGILLQGEGHEVRKVYDGDAALEVAERWRPEVALLDIGMPGLSGYEVSERIRAQPWGQGIVLIALTGWGQAQDKARALAAGFDQHLTKPVEPERLQSLLSLARSARGREALRSKEPQNLA